jgi:hypothetical protein
LSDELGDGDKDQIQQTLLAEFKNNVLVQKGQMLSALFEKTIRR